MKVIRLRRKIIAAVMAAVIFILISWSAAVTWAVLRTENMAEGGVTTYAPSEIAEVTG